MMFGRGLHSISVVAMVAEVELDHSRKQIGCGGEAEMVMVQIFWIQIDIDGNKIVGFKSIWTTT